VSTGTRQYQSSAAAFSVKLTLDRPAIVGASKDAATLRRGIADDQNRSIGNSLSP